MMNTGSDLMLNVHHIFQNKIISLFQDDHTQHVAQGPGHQKWPRGQPPAGLGALCLWPLPCPDDLPQPRGASLPRGLQVRPESSIRCLVVIPGSHRLKFKTCKVQGT